MDNPSDKYLSNVNRPGPFSAVRLTVLGIVRWFIGFFKLSEEDRFKAGLYIGSEGVADKPERTVDTSILEKTMKKEIGLWIDHRKAVMVTIENEGIVTREIRSNMEKKVRFSSGTRSKSPDNSQGSTAEDMRDRQFGDHLGRYYEGVVSFIRDADAIWIFGPGEAKVELGNRFKQEGLAERIVGVDTVDKMTDRQIEAKVRDRFQR